MTQLAKRRHRTRKASVIGSCFVLMPFKPDLDELYAKSIKLTIERTGVLQCLRADEIYGPRPIMADIWKSIRQSKLVIADLTGRNPNVFYELGLAHAIQKPVILLSQNVDDVPFDLRHVRVIIYKNTELGRNELQTKLHNTLQVIFKEIEKASVVEQYAVLEAPEQLRVPVGKGVERLLRSLRNKDPKKILKTLSRIISTFQHREKPKNCDPRILGAILPCTHSSFPEVQLAAIRAVGAAGDRVHAGHLHSFLSSSNPTLVEESIRALGELQDLSVVPRLVSMFDDPTYQICRDDILQALSKIGGDKTTPFLAKIATDNQASLRERKLAIQSLGKTHGDEGIDVLLGLDVDGLDDGLRHELAKVFVKIEPLYQPTRLKRMEAQLRILLSDKSPEVRGRAIAAWCLHSFEPFDGKLDRSFLWDQLQKENEDTLWEFFAVLGLYETSFAPEESNRLVKLAEKHPTISGSVVFVLQDIGDESVSDFMLKAYNESKEDDTNQLWVLNYLSRVPSKSAVELLRNEIQKGSDPSRISLAAIALSRMGIEDTADLLLQNVFEAHEWVRTEAQDFLAERLRHEKSSEKQEALRRALRKLSKE